MTDTTLPIEQQAAPAPSDTSATIAAIEHGVEAGLAAAIPATVAVAGISNPTVGALVTAATALEPAVANLIQMSQAGLLTPEQLASAIAAMKANVANIHAGWLASVAQHPGV